MLTPQPEGSYTVTSPDVLDLVTEWETCDEAIEMARDCAEALILTNFDVYDEIPEKGGRAELATIAVDLGGLRAIGARKGRDRVGRYRRAPPETARRASLTSIGRFSRAKAWLQAHSGSRIVAVARDHG